jgi:hypothetical protein
VQWLRTGDTTASNAGARVVDVTEGAMLQVRGQPVTLTHTGFVRAHRMALPLKQGIQLIAGLALGPHSLSELGMDLAGGFVASTSPSTADRVDLFKADENTAGTGYRSLSLIGLPGTGQWLAMGEAPLTSQNEVALIKPMRAMFIKSVTAKPGFMVPLTWRP